MTITNEEFTATVNRIEELEGELEKARKDNKELAEGLAKAVMVVFEVTARSDMLRALLKATLEDKKAKL